jgi:hypothetical protein
MTKDILITEVKRVADLLKFDYSNLSDAELFSNITGVTLSSFDDIDEDRLSFLRKLIPSGAFVSSKDTDDESTTTVAPVTTDVPVTTDTPVTTDAPFSITKSIFVKDEETYNTLPESYRSTHGEWGIPHLEESLPWLAVEFTPTPAKDLSIKVEGPSFTKDITYPEIEKEVSLLTLDDDELGTTIVDGDWTVTINGVSTVINVVNLVEAPVDNENPDSVSTVTVNE